MNVENVIRYLVLAYLHSDEILHDECFDFIDEKKKVFWERDDFKQLCKNYPDLFYEVTKFMFIGLI